MSLEDTIRTLKAAGLLERASFIKTGDVEVQLGPPAMAVVEEEPPSIIDEQRAFAEAMYRSSQGGVPGVG